MTTGPSGGAHRTGLMRWAFSAWAAVLLAIGLSTLPTGALAQRGTRRKPNGAQRKSLARASPHGFAANPLLSRRRGLQGGRRRQQSVQLVLTS